MKFKDVELEGGIDEQFLEDNFLSNDPERDNNLEFGVNNSLILLDFLKTKYFKGFSEQFSGKEIHMLIRVIGSIEFDFHYVLNSVFELNINEYSVKDYLDNTIDEHKDGERVTKEEIKNVVRKKIFNFFLPILEDDPFHSHNRQLYDQIRRFDVINLIMLLWWVSFKTSENKKLSKEAGRIFN